MIRTLEYLDRRWGGTEPFLQQHGLTVSELGELRMLLTEAAD